MTDFLCEKNRNGAKVIPTTWWAEMDSKVVQVVLSCVIQNHLVPFQSRLYQRFQTFFEAKIPQPLSLPEMKILKVKATF